MATTFERIGSSVKVTKGSKVFSVPVQAMIYPDARKDDFIIISHQYNPQDEAEGLAIDIDDVQGIAFTDRNDLIEKLSSSFFFNQILITPLGGIAVRMINKTGALSVKGTVVQASATVDNAFEIVPQGDDDPIGVIFESGIPDGEPCYIVIYGIAEIMVQDGLTTGNGYHCWVSSNQDGRIGTSSGVNTNRHWGEVGHAIEAKAAGTDILVKCIIHFN